MQQQGKPPAGQLFFPFFTEFVQTCPFGHDYDLPPEEVEVMRQAALKAPCRFANDSALCQP